MTLIAAMLLSAAVAELDSVPELGAVVGTGYWYAELCFTSFFTLEYLTRVWCKHNRLCYVLSFWSIVDLPAIVPTYIAFSFPEAAPLVVIRLSKVLRVFRVFHLVSLFAQLNEIHTVLRNISRSIFVFPVMVMLLVVVFACVIYAIEGPAHRFTSIPLSICWAVVTITTVGCGDLVPQTAADRFVAGFGTLVGYSLIAVPTAIITRKHWERINEQRAVQPTLPRNCPVCAKQGHALVALFCQHCGAELDAPSDIRGQAQRDV